MPSSRRSSRPRRPSSAKHSTRPRASAPAKQSLRPRASAPAKDSQQTRASLPNSKVPSQARSSVRGQSFADLLTGTTVKRSTPGLTPSQPARGSIRDLDALVVAPATLATLRSWVQRHYGLSFATEQHELFAGRIGGLCRELELSGEALLAKLNAGEREISLRVAEVVSTNYTFFRREPEIFDYLSEQVFPQLPRGGLRFWSAAASSGDEAYSIAMASFEYFGSEARTRVQILGTDISERQILLAERGVYRREQLALLDTARLARFFTPAERGQLRVADTLKELCTFRRLNLNQERWPFTKRFHVIFLRNVLYYFDAPVRRQILENCYDAAEPGAVLFTSLTEPMIDVATRWSPVRHAVFRRGGP